MSEVTTVETKTRKPRRTEKDPNETRNKQVPVWVDDAVKEFASTIKADPQFVYTAAVIEFMKQEPKAQLAGIMDAQVKALEVNKAVNDSKHAA